MAIARTRLLVVALAILVTGSLGQAADPPVPTVDDIILTNNRIHSEAEIRDVMTIKPGMLCDEKVIREDVQRLMATKWFVAGGVKILTKPVGGNQVIVYVMVAEAPAPQPKE